MYKSEILYHSPVGSLCTGKATAHCAPAGNANEEGNPAQSLSLSVQGKRKMNRAPPLHICIHILSNGSSEIPEGPGTNHSFKNLVACL